MTTPSNPSLDDLVNEGLFQSGQRSAPASHKTRVKNEWFRDIKNDLWRMLDKPKVLQVTAHAMFPKGQSRFSNPGDYSSDLELTILDGSITGVSVGGGANYIDLADGTQGGDDTFLGKQVIISSGAGQASQGQIITYDPVTRRASVTPPFRSSPAAGSGYLVVDCEIPLAPLMADQYKNKKRLGLGVPQFVFPFGDEDFGEFFLDCPPNKAYAARLQYYANIAKIDVDSPWMSTLYDKWRDVWIKGIIWKDKKENHNDEWQSDFQLYEKAISELKAKSYGLEVSNLQQIVTDY